MIILCCGDFFVAQSNHPYLNVISDPTKTQSEIFTKAYALASHDDHGTWFSNDEQVLYGLRVAIVDGRLDTEDLEIQYYEFTGLMTRVRLNEDGGGGKWPDGCFDGNVKALAKLNTARIIKKRESRKFEL